MTDDTGEPDARKPARPVRGRGVEKVPPPDGNSSASYPTLQRFGPGRAGFTWQPCLISFRVGWSDGPWQHAKMNCLLRTPYVWHCNNAVRKWVYCTILPEGGSHTSQQYQQVLTQFGITVSMSRRGNCYDNAVSESFFGTLKRECVDRVSFQTRTQARQAIFEYTEVFYNRVRRHSSLGYKSPVAYEQLMC
jgi:Integrase core domain